MLEDNFRLLLFDSCFNLLGGRRNFAKHLGASYTAVTEWYHGKKKQFLEYLVRRQNRGWKFPDPKSIRKIIVDALKQDSHLTARELSTKTLITARNLRTSYLYPMENEGIVQKTGKRKGKGGPVLWGLKE